MTSIDDVRQVRPDLTDDQARDVLYRMDNNDDGTDWFGEIELTADDLFPRN